LTPTCTALSAQGISIEVVSDWFYQDSQARGKVSVFLKENVGGSGGAGQVGHLELSYKHIDAGNGNNPKVYLYLRVKPDYIGCKKSTCKDYDHKVVSYVSGGTGYVRGDAPQGAGVDPNLAANIRNGLYTAANMIELSKVQ